MFSHKTLHLFLVSMLPNPRGLIFQKPVLWMNICCPTCIKLFSLLLYCHPIAWNSVLWLTKMIKPCSSGGTWFQCAYEIILSQKWKYQTNEKLNKTHSNKRPDRLLSIQAFCTIQNRLPGTKTAMTSWQHGKMSSKLYHVDSAVVKQAALQNVWPLQRRAGEEQLLPSPR